MARPRRYTAAQVAREIGVHRHTVSRWAGGALPVSRGCPFPLDAPLQTTPTGKLLLHPASVDTLRAWVQATKAGNRGKARADVLQAAAAARPAREKARKFLDARRLRQDHLQRAEAESRAREAQGERDDLQRKRQARALATRQAALWASASDVQTILDYLRAKGRSTTVETIIDLLAARSVAYQERTLGAWRRYLAEHR